MVEFANHLYSKTVGTDRKLLGQKLVDALPEADPELIAIQKRIFETGRPFISKSLPIILDYDRNQKPYERIWNLIYQPTRGSDGSVDGVLTCAIDATELVRGIKTVEAANAEMRIERELRERFVAALTHNLRTPLSSIKCSAQLLLRKAESDTAARVLAQRIVMGAVRADRMIRDLLDANKIKAGHGIPIFVTKCSLDPIATAALGDFEAIYGPRFKIVRENGRERLEKIRLLPKPSFVLLDMMMPNLDGRAFMDEVLKDVNQAPIPILVVSASTQPEKAHGSCAFIKKPADLDILLQLVEKFTSVKSADA